jgi:hypothetical protein
MRTKLPSELTRERLTSRGYDLEFWHRMWDRLVKEKYSTRLFYEGWCEHDD